MCISTQLPSEPPPAGERTPDVNEPGERERLMAEFSIAYNGRRYEYDIYRYDHLADAVNYARLQRSKPSRGEIHSRSSPEYGEDPDESQRALMATLGITFQDGVYRLGAFQYDRLTDAVNYARLQLQSPAPV